MVGNSTISVVVAGSELDVNSWFFEPFLDDSQYDRI